MAVSMKRSTKNHAVLVNFVFDGVRVHGDFDDYVDLVGQFFCQQVLGRGSFVQTFKK